MRKNKSNQQKNVISKKIWITTIQIVKDIIRCFMMSCGVAYLLIFFYWEEATSLPLTRSIRSVLMELSNTCFFALLTVLIIFRISNKVKDILKI